jgi:CCR4-NOT transcriptional regulation complex NOT5 subunit
MKQFPDKVLFYIFYNMPHDKSQLSASNELQSRSWIYIGDMVKWIKINSSKKEQQHFTSKKNSKNVKGQKNLKIESSSYSIIIFNPKLWKEEQVYLQED